MRMPLRPPVGDADRRGHGRLHRFGQPPAALRAGAVVAHEVAGATTGRVGLEAHTDVHITLQQVGLTGVNRLIRVMESVHRGATAGQDPPDAVRQGGQAARLAHDDPAAPQCPGRIPEALAFPDLGHHVPPVGMPTHHLEDVQGLGPDDAVRHRDAHVALEVADRGVGLRSEDPVDPAGVEAERAHAPLQRSHVVPPKHGPPVVQQPVAEGVPGFDERAPCLLAAHTITAQPAPRLESEHRLLRAGPEDRSLIASRVEAQRLQSFLQVTDSFSATLTPQRQRARWDYRNGCNSSRS